MKRALLLINPKSRKGATARDELRPLLEKGGISVLETSERDPGLFSELIERFKDKVDLVIVAGGDGSCLSVVEKLHAFQIPLGVIPMGTANNLARSLEIPFSLAEAVQVIVKGEKRKIDIAFVNGKPFLNVSGMGLSTQVNRHVPSETKKRWGVFAYIVYLFKMARRTRPFKAEITCDGKTTHLKSLQITVCNGRFYGSGLKIAEDARIDDHRLDLLSVNPRNWWEGLILIPKLISGRYPLHQAIHVSDGKKIEIKTTPLLTLDTDGEITTRTPATYETLSEALCVYAAAPSAKKTPQEEAPKTIPS